MAETTTAGTPALSTEPWRAANHGAGKRGWFVTRGGYNGPQEYFYNANGNVTRYGSWEAAQKVADGLNAAAGVALAGVAGATP